MYKYNNTKYLSLEQHSTEDQCYSDQCEEHQHSNTCTAEQSTEQQITAERCGSGSNKQHSGPRHTPTHRGGLRSPWNLIQEAFSRSGAIFLGEGLPLFKNLIQEALSGSGNGQCFISWRTPSLFLKSDTRGNLQIKSWPMTVLHFLRKAFSSLYL